MRPRVPRRRTALRLAGALLVTLVAVDLAVSRLVVPDGVYVWQPLPPFSACMTEQQRAWVAAERNEQARGVEEGLTRFDPVLGWCTQAGRRTPPAARPGYTYNGLGARARRDYEPQPPGGALRLACFGDSFTHGDEVDDEDTWERQLELLDPRLEALNFGVGGYGTDQALLRMRREGLHGAQVACMGLLVENIGRNVNRYRPAYWPPSPSCVAKPRFVLRDGRLELVALPYASRAELLEAVASGRVLEDLSGDEHWIAETRWRWIAPSSLLRFAAGWWAYRRRETARLYADQDGEPYRVTLELLTTFADEARALGARHAPVLVFPARRELEACADGGHRFWQPLIDELRTRQVEVLDLTPALLAAWGERGGELFSGGHYSRKGNALVAQALLEWCAGRFPAR